MGFKAWYDNRASDLTKEGMLKGIEQAAAFVLFLSQGVLQRPYCQLEIRHALALKKPIVLLHENDASATGCCFWSVPAVALTTHSGRRRSEVRVPVLSKRTASTLPAKGTRYGSVQKIPFFISAIKAVFTAAAD